MGRPADFIRIGIVSFKLATAFLLFAFCSALAQSTPAEPGSSLEQRIDKLSVLLAATQAQVEQSQRELVALRAELASIKQQGTVSKSVPQPNSDTDGTSSSIADKVEQQGEQQQILQAEVDQHEQTKVETESKFSLKVHGLILFNAFSNAGVVDDSDLPAVAFPLGAGYSGGSAGGSIRQTLLGIRATGPHIAGAATAADLTADFFGELSYSLYGSASGNFRVRTADVSASWAHAALHLGVDTPLISPLSPTSYATIAIPSLAWSGNLWAWAPQLRYEHRLSLSNASSLLFEVGLLDPR